MKTQKTRGKKETKSYRSVLRVVSGFLLFTNCWTKERFSRAAEPVITSTQSIVNYIGIANLVIN